jgi:hypothetical protein
VTITAATNVANVIGRRKSADPRLFIATDREAAFLGRVRDDFGILGFLCLLMMSRLA